MITSALIAAGTAALYRTLLAIGHTGPPGSVRAKMVKALGGGGPGAVQL